MTIMIIFLILSVVLIIGTEIYVSHKKNSYKYFNNKKTNTDKNKKRKSKNRKELKDFFKVEIKDDIICYGNRYSKVIRLGNVDYNMLSTEEQDSIESILIQTALSIDYNVQFFSTTEYIDTSEVISLIKENKNTNIKIQEYKEYLIEYLQNLMENRKITIIKNYAIITYDGLYKNAIEELERKAISLKANLLRGKITCEILNNDEINNLFYRELNKNSVQNISHLVKGGEKLYVQK